MPRKFKSDLTNNQAKRNGFILSFRINPHLRIYLEHRATAESKTLTQVLIDIITKEKREDRFYNE